MSKCTVIVTCCSAAMIINSYPVFITWKKTVLTQSALMAFFVF